jgi:hypothetical protein
MADMNTAIFEGHQEGYEKHQAEEWCDCFDNLIIDGPGGKL